MRVVDIIIIAAIAVSTFLIVRDMVKKHKAGITGCGCGGSCSGCSGCSLPQKRDME